MMPYKASSKESLEHARLLADRAGIKTMLLPRRNERDLEDIPPEVLKEMELIFVDTVDDVLRLALRQPVEQEQQPAAEAARSERTVLN
jgi:ATP-dependent Lon protease